MERPRQIDRIQRDPEKLAEARHIGIATATMYPEWKPLPQGAVRSMNDVSGLRGDLALKMLKSAKAKGFQIGVVDGGSSEEFRQTLQETVGITVSKEKRKGMSPSRRQAFGEVSAMDGVKVVAWTEPEKVSMVDSLLKAAQPILEGKADVVVPKRDAKAFATYPDYQAVWENRANEEFNRQLKDHGLLPQDAEELDVWGGTRLLKNDPNVLKFFTHQWELDQNDPKFDEGKMDPELWPNALFLPVIGTLWKDRISGNPPSVISVPVDYKHPAEQTAMEQDSPAFQAKRKQQFENIIGATAALLQVLEHDAAQPKEKQLYVRTK